MSARSGRDPSKASPGRSPIRSKELWTLVMTRAQIVGMMADPRLGPLAKQVGCLLWAITETWGEREVKRVPWSEVADHIVYPGGKTASERGVRNAVAELEEAGYIVVDRTGCGRGRPARTRMIRRAVGDPLLEAAKGSDWRVWTEEQSRQGDSDEDAEAQKAAPEKGASQKGASEKPASEQPPLGLKGASEEPPLALKGAAEQPPYKETSYKETFQADCSLPSHLASGVGASRPTFAVEAEFVAGEDWEHLTSAERITGFLRQHLTEDGRTELDGRKTREVTKGIRTLLRGGATVPEIVLGLGYWVGDREMAQADILAEVVTTRLQRLTYDVEDLSMGTPVDVLRDGFSLGRASRDERQGRTP